jgi:uncharacterized protein GlcG (DUF336 family)
MQNKHEARQDLVHISSFRLYRQVAHTAARQILDDAGELVGGLGISGSRSSSSSGSMGMVGGVYTCLLLLGPECEL